MEMKFIITESKREELIDKYLSKEYGGLKKGESKNHPDLVFFIRDADHNLTGKDIVFHYTKDNQGAVIPWEMVRDVEIFTGDEWDAKQLVKKWLKKTYGIDPVKLFRKF